MNPLPLRASNTSKSNKNPVSLGADSGRSRGVTFAIPAISLRNPRLLLLLFLVFAQPGHSQFRLPAPTLPNSNTVQFNFGVTPQDCQVTILSCADAAARPASWTTCAVSRPGQCLVNVPTRPGNQVYYKAQQNSGAAPAPALSPIVFESFSGVGTLDPDNPGALGTIVTGKVLKRAVGPRTTPEDQDGWSGELRGPFVSRTDLSASNLQSLRRSGMLGFWVRFTDFGNAAYPNHFAQVCQLTTAGDNNLLLVGVNKSGDVYVVDTSSITIPDRLDLHTWYYFVVEYQNLDPLHICYRVSVMPLNGTLQLIRDRTAFNPGSGRQVERIYVLDQQNGSGGPWYGRIGAMGLYPIAQVGHAEVPPGIYPPIEKRRTWYVNPATGNDQNNGLSPSQAWASAEKLNEELTYSGVMGTLTPWRLMNGATATPLQGDLFTRHARTGDLQPNGDILLIDTQIAPLTVTTQINVGSRVPGLWITSASTNQAELSVFKTIPSGHWTPTLYPHIFQTTNTEPYVVLWENRHWLNHATGSVFSAAAAFLEATPGSFWTDGNVLYVHPFDDSSPVLNGKTYERSRLLGNTANHALTVTGHDVTIDNLRIGGTSLVDYQATANPANLNHYCLQVLANNNVVRDCFLHYGSKHNFGVLGGSDNGAIYAEGIQCEQGSPLTTSGGQSVFVVYASASTNMVAWLKNCRSTANAGKIGSSSGTATEAFSVFLTHSTSQGGTQWKDLILENCSFPSLRIDQADNAIENGVTITNCHFGSGTFTKARVERCFVDCLNVVPNLSGDVTVRNSIFVPAARLCAAELTGRIQGRYVVEGCTFDLSFTPLTGNVALFTRYAPVNLTFRNNLVIGKSSALLSGITFADTIALSHNLYNLGTTQKLILSYSTPSGTGDLTFQQWRDLNFDDNSFLGDPRLDANYIPLPGSPAVDAGLDLGPAADFSGRLFPIRNDIGAYEVAAP